MRLERLAEETGLERRVRFLGFVPEDDLPALYRAADVFAIASLCEVQSLPTLQAVATGLPVVAADAAALPELVRPGPTRRRQAVCVGLPLPMDVPWPHHMVEHFFQLDQELVAVLSNGELLAAPLMTLFWRRVLPELASVRAVAAIKV